MSARWFYKVGEGEIGPVDVVEVERLIKNGRLGPEDRIRDEESDLFRAVRRVPRFAEILPKTVVKSRLEAAELEEVKRNPKLRHRANTKAAK
ncbi:MAG: GYF domain-containing protein, partial [Planctomycetota bacterium]